MGEANKDQDFGLPEGFVRLTIEQGRPAIVTRDEHGDLTTQFVERFMPRISVLSSARLQRGIGVLLDS